MLALGVASAATNAISRGRIDQSTLLSTTSSAAAMIGMRMIPGVGWAATAYAVADLGSRALVGKAFGETMVGKPIDWALDKAGRGGLAAATGAMDLVGWKGGSDFLRNTVYPWAYPDDQSNGTKEPLTAQERADNRVSEARQTGLLPKDPATPVLVKGPSHEMIQADTISDRPVPSSLELPLKGDQVDLAALAAQPVRATLPSEATVQERRADLLVREHVATHSEGVDQSLDMSLVDGRKSSNLAAAVSAEAAVTPTIAPTKAPIASKPMGRSYDD